MGTSGDGRPAPLKIVRLSWEWLIPTIAVLGAFAAGCLCVAGWYLLYGKDQTVNLLMELMFLGFAVSCAVFAWIAYRSELVVWADRIESTNGFYFRTIRKSEIRGLRFNTQVPKAWVVSTDEYAKSITIPTSLLTDPSTQHFFEGLPDLGAVEYQRDLEVLENDPRFGATPEDRRKRLSAIVKIIKFLNLIGLGIGIWALVWPRPYEVAIYATIACVPLALFVKIWAGSLVDLDDRNNDPRPSISDLYFLPAGVIALRALLDITLIDWQAELIWAGVAGIGISVTFLLVDRSARKSSAYLLLILILNFPYAYGALAELNYLPDHSPPKVFHAKVSDLRISRGKTTTYSVVLGNWGPFRLDKK